MRRLNRKGFTLIELLAVIVIMGILMIVAIPMVTQYIDSARKDTYIDTAKAYINSARYAYLANDYDCPSNIDSSGGGIAFVRLEDIAIDNSGGKSSFGGKFTEDGKTNGYVAIQSTGEGEYTYYITIRDSKSYGVANFVAESELNKTHVKSGVTTVSNTLSGVKAEEVAGGNDTICNKVS